MHKNIKCEQCGLVHDSMDLECPHCETPTKDEFAIKASTMTFVPLWKQAISFIIGWAGFQIIALIISAIVSFAVSKTYPTGSTEYTNYMQFQGAAIANLSSYALLACALIGTLNKDIKKLFKSFKGWKPYVAALIGFAIIIAFNVVYTSILNAAGITLSDNENESALGRIITVTPVLSLLIFGIIGPLCEEITYRLGLYSFLRRINFWAAIIISSLVFTLIHFDFGCFTKGSDTILVECLNIPLYLCAAIVFNVLYEKFGFASSLACHTLNNLVSIVSTISKK